MEYRILSNDEIEQLVQPIIAEQGWTLLNINDSNPTCVVIGAFGDRGLVGFGVIQLFPLIGPLYVVPGSRNGVVSAGIIDEMGKLLVDARGYMVVCESEVSERIAKHHQLKRIDFPVYIKE